MVMNSLGQKIRKSGPNPVLGGPGQYNYWDWNSRRRVTRPVVEADVLALTAFFRGIQLIASTIAAFPMHVYEEKKDGTRQTITTPDTSYLWQRPNPEMIRMTMWEHVIADEVRGNGYVFVDKNALGKPESIWHLPRRWVTPGRTPDGQKVYKVLDELPMIDYRDGGEIVHFTNWGNGLCGYDPMLVAPEAIRLGLSAQDYAEQFFDGDAIPPGYISTDQPLTPAESLRIADRWQQRQSGPANWRKIAVLGNGAKFTTLQGAPETTQMSSVRTFQGEEICRLLGIPPHMLGYTDKVTSWGQGIAEQGRGFVTYTLQSHITRFEQGIDDALLVRGLTDRFVKFDPDGLLRGTPAQRAAFYALAWGRWMVPNEIRRMEDLPPVPGGDEMPVGANLIPLDELGANLIQAATSPGNPDLPQDQQTQDQANP